MKGKYQKKLFPRGTDKSIILRIIKLDNPIELNINKTLFIPYFSTIPDNSRRVYYKYKQETVIVFKYFNENDLVKEISISTHNQSHIEEILKMYNLH